MKRKRLDDRSDEYTVAERWRDFRRREESAPSAAVRHYVRAFSAAFKLAPSLYQFGKKREKL